MSQAKPSNSIAPCDPALGLDGWGRFVRQLHFDARLWLLGVLLLAGLRGLLMWIFADRISEQSGFADRLAVFGAGFRFDARSSSAFILPSFVLSVACLFVDLQKLAEKIRGVMLVALVMLCTIMGGLNLGYFKEYHDQFNHYVLGVIFDDFSAVLVTIWKDYPVVWGALGAAALIVALIWAGRRLVLRDWLGPRRAAKLCGSTGRRITLLAASLILLAFAVRGSISNRPVQQKDAAITKDHILNKMVLNPLAAMRYAIMGHLELTGGKGLEVYLKDRDVRKAAKLLAGGDAEPADVDAALRRVARGPKGRKPRHVFFIMMESYDAWPSLEKYRSLGLSERVLNLGGRGIFTRNFVSASSGTMTSYAAIITGLADAGVTTNYQPLARKPFPSSINPILQRLGLRTRMFLGGYFSWQRSDGFCTEQGFQELYSGAHITQWLKANEWGPDDRELYDFVLKTVDPAVPSFNFVLTSSFHPPYSVDVYGRGFPHKEIPADLKEMFAGTNISMRELGHFWYADQMMGKFVDEAAKKYPDSLFIVTGDHWSRRFIGAKPTLYERTAVPLVMYGPEVLKGIKAPANLAGSHLDIMPTVFELLADKGFEYHSVGTDLLDPSREQVGFGREKIIGPDFLAPLDPGEEVSAVPGAELKISAQDIARLRAKYNAIHGLAWWRICKGAAFESRK